MKRITLSGFIIPVFIILAYSMAVAQKPASDGSGPAYLIGPGDEVAVKVMGEPTFDFKATIDDEGMG